MKKVKLKQEFIDKIKETVKQEPDELTKGEADALNDGGSDSLRYYYVKVLRGILLDPKEGEIVYNEKRKESTQEICERLLKQELLETIDISDKDKKVLEIVDEKLHNLAIHSGLDDFRAAVVEIDESVEKCRLTRFFEGKESKPPIRIEGNTIKSQCFNFYRILQDMNRDIHEKKKEGKKPIKDAFLITRSENTKVGFMVRLDKPFVLMLETPRIVLAGMILVQMKNTLRDILDKI